MKGLVRTRQQTVQDGLNMIWKLASGGYPRFVLGGPLRGIPVFCLHEVEPAVFEPQLQFLRQNDYQTLTNDEFCEIASGSRRAPARAVMLTFDDGWGTLWSCGLPLLKRYGMKAVLYLATGRIPEGGIGPTLNDLETGRCDRAAVLGRDHGAQPFVTWDEVRALHASGLVDVQSHSLTHSRVFCSPRIEDFVRPGLLRQLSVTRLPEWTPDTSEVPAAGRPIYYSAPRLSERRRYIEDPALRQACQAHVADQGGAAFFERPAWRKELTGWFARLRAAQGDQGRYETDEEREAAIWRELAESKRLIEQHLPGKTVRHFAYPWDNSCGLGIRLSWKAGYVSNLVGHVDGKQMRVRLGQPMLVSRLGGDWLLTLPGRGRRSIADPLFVKCGRGVVKPTSVCQQAGDPAGEPAGWSAGAAGGGRT